MSRLPESYEPLHSEPRKSKPHYLTHSVDASNSYSEAGTPSRDGAKKLRETEQREEEKRRKKAGRVSEADYADSRYEDGSRRDPSRRGNLSQFFLDGDGIHREVLQMEICKYLGSEAVSRPYKYDGTEGFMLNAVRSFTQEEIDKIKLLSDAFKSEVRHMKQDRGKDISYGASETRDLRESILRVGSPYQPGYAPDPILQPMGVPQAEYQSLSSLSSPTYLPAQGGTYQKYSYSQAGGYSPAATYPSLPIYSATGQPIISDAIPYSDSYINPGTSIGHPPVSDQYLQYPPENPRGLRTDFNVSSPFAYDVNAPLGHSSAANYSDYSTASPPRGRGASFHPSYESSYDPSYDPSNGYQENVFTGTGRTYR